MKESGKNVLGSLGFFKCTLLKHGCRHRTKDGFCLTKEQCIYHELEKQR